jgi:hypothetical protein
MRCASSNASRPWRFSTQLGKCSSHGVGLVIDISRRRRWWALSRGNTRFRHSHGRRNRWWSHRTDTIWQDRSNCSPRRSTSSGARHTRQSYSTERLSSNFRLRLLSLLRGLDLLRRHRRLVLKIHLLHVVGYTVRSSIVLGDRFRNMFLFLLFPMID